MEDVQLSGIQPSQTDVPKILLLPDKSLPKGFKFPAEFLFLVDCRIVYFPPWQLLSEKWTQFHYDGLRGRYPKRRLVPFARRLSSDDIACWEDGNNQQVVVVHDHASAGWEDRGERYPSFWSWFKSAVDEMIESEFGDR